MKIIKNEMRKIVKSPIIIGLTIVFIVFNLFIITGKFSHREDLRVLNKIVKTVGYKIDDNMLINFKNYYEENLNEANKIINEKSGKTYKTIGKFYEDTRGKELGFYSENQKKKIRETAVIESYYYSIEQKDIDYENINMEKIAEGEINAMGLSEDAAEIIRGNYKRFQERLEDIRVKGEQKSLFFHGQAHRMHSFLFADILRNIIFEATTLGCLIMLFIVNYEFDNNTSLITYATKRGRSLVKDKVLAGLICVGLITTVILGITLLVYFSIFSYEDIWKIPISSYFNWEPRENRPFISWFSLNIRQYLLLSIALVYVVQMIFAGISFLIARITRNTYIGFFIFFIIGTLGVLLPSWMPGGSSFIIYSCFTPFSLILSPNFWFMESGALTSYKYYELITVCIWGIIMIMIGKSSIKRFKREALN